MRKHTPGSWSVREYPRYSNIGTELGIVSDQSNWFVAKDVAHHDASLICAAPDLLSACKLARACVCSHPDGHHRQFVECLEVLEAAVEKAEDSNAVITQEQATKSESDSSSLVDEPEQFNWLGTEYNTWKRCVEQLQAQVDELRARIERGG